MSNNNVPAAAPALAPIAAALRRRGGGGFPDLDNRRFRTAVFYAVWGGAGILSTTTAPNLSVNLDHVLLYFTFLMAGVTLHLLSIAAADLPWMEGLAGSLEGILEKLIGPDF